jgi:hypothetical protein
MTNSDFASVIESVDNSPTLTANTQAEVLGENLENGLSSTNSNLLHTIIIASFFFTRTVSYFVLLCWYSCIHLDLDKNKSQTFCLEGGGRNNLPPLVSSMDNSLETMNKNDIF